MSKKFSNVNLNSLAKGRTPASNPSQRSTARSIITPARGLVSLGPQKQAAVKKPAASAWGQPQKEEPEPPPEENVESPPDGCDLRPPEEVPETPEIVPEKADAADAGAPSIRKTNSLSWADASEVWEDRDEWLLRSKSAAKPNASPIIPEEATSKESAGGRSGSVVELRAADADDDWRRTASTHQQQQLLQQKELDVTHPHHDNAQAQQRKGGRQHDGEYQQQPHQAYQVYKQQQPPHAEDAVEHQQHQRQPQHQQQRQYQVFQSQQPTTEQQHPQRQHSTPQPSQSLSQHPLPPPQECPPCDEHSPPTQRSPPKQRSPRQPRSAPQQSSSLQHSPPQHILPSPPAHQQHAQQHHNYTEHDHDTAKSGDGKNAWKKGDGKGRQNKTKDEKDNDKWLRGRRDGERCDKEVPQAQQPPNLPPQQSPALPQRSPQNQRLQQERQQEAPTSISPRDFQVQNVPSTALVINLTKVLKRLRGSCSIQQLLKALPSLKEDGVSVERFILAHSHVFDLKGRIVYLKDHSSATIPMDEDGHEDGPDSADWRQGGGTRQGDWQRDNDWHEEYKKGEHNQSSNARSQEHGNRSSVDPSAGSGQQQGGGRKKNVPAPTNAHHNGPNHESPRTPQRAHDRNAQRQQAGNGKSAQCNSNNEWNAGNQEENSNAQRQQGRKQDWKGKGKNKQRSASGQDWKKKDKARSAANADASWRQTSEQSQQAQSQRNRGGQKKEWKDEWNEWGDNDWWTAENNGGSGTKAKKW